MVTLLVNCINDAACFEIIKNKLKISIKLYKFC